ncbi:MAG TPA: hypothetical protein VKR32_06670, partial [Puia sp.]|nr:hypothetical protein [Puia sp.]
NGVVILSLMFVTCKEPQAPDYKGIESLTITQIGLNQSRVVAQIKLYNPNKFRLQLKYADVNISADNKFIGRCIIDSTILIPRADSFFIPVSVNIDLRNILGNAMQLLLRGQVKFNGDGFVRLKKTGICFRVPVHFQQMERADSLLQQIH